MVAGAAEVAVVGGALLLAVGLADRAVHVEDEPGELAVPVGAIDPLAGEVHQPVQVVAGREGLGLEAGDLAGRGRRVVPGPTAHHGAHRGIDAESLGVVEVLVPGQAAVDRLTQQGGRGCAEYSGRSVCRAARSAAECGEVEGVVEFAVGQQSGIAGDVGAVEFEAEAAVELGSEWLGLAVTHRESLSGRQETSENPGKPGSFAQVLCQTQGFIWEIRVES